MQEIYKVRLYKDDSAIRRKIFRLGPLIGALIIFLLVKFFNLDDNDWTFYILFLISFTGPWFFAFYRPFCDTLSLTSDSIIIKGKKDEKVQIIFFKDLQKTKVIVTTEDAGSGRSGRRINGLTTARIILTFFTLKETLSYEVSWNTIQKMNEEFVQYGLLPIDGINSRTNTLEKNSANVEIWSMVAILPIGILVVFGVVLYMYIKYS
jgi:hypothetical protein